MATIHSVEAYLDSLTTETRRVLEELRGTILGLLPHELIARVVRHLAGP